MWIWDSLNHTHSTGTVVIHFLQVHGDFSLTLYYDRTSGLRGQHSWFRSFLGPNFNDRFSRYYLVFVDFKISHDRVLSNYFLFAIHEHFSMSVDVVYNFGSWNRVFKYPMEVRPFAVVFPFDEI